MQERLRPIEKPKHQIVEPDSGRRINSMSNRIHSFGELVQATMKVTSQNEGITQSILKPCSDCPLYQEGALIPCDKITWVGGINEIQCDGEFRQQPIELHENVTVNIGETPLLDENE